VLVVYKAQDSEVVIGENSLPHRGFHYEYFLKVIAGKSFQSIKHFVEYMDEFCIHC
jgi:hypothetical protein